MNLKNILQKIPLPVIWLINTALFLLYFFITIILLGLFARFLTTVNVAIADLFEFNENILANIFVCLGIAIVIVSSVFLRDFLYFKSYQSEGKKFKGFLVVIGSILLLDLITTAGLFVYDTILQEYWHVLLFEFATVVFFFFVARAFFKKSKQAPIFLKLYFFASFTVPILHSRFHTRIQNPLREVDETYMIYIAYCLIAFIYITKSQNVKNIFAN